MPDAPTPLDLEAIRDDLDAIRDDLDASDRFLKKWVRLPVKHVRAALAEVERLTAEVQERDEWLHETAAPSATREAVARAIRSVTDAYRAERGMSRHTGLTAHDESVIRDQAAHVVSLADARFTITPKEDR